MREEIRNAGGCHAANLISLFKDIIITLFSRYANKGKDQKRLSLSEFIVTIPVRDSYYAMYVPKHLNVTLETARGDVLHTNLTNAPHGEGDYLICTIGEDGGPNLSDVWVLNGLIFPNCYDTSHMSE